MLEKFRNEQNLFVEEIEKVIKNNMISHAFLIETKNYKSSYELILAFVKELFKSYVVDTTEFNNITALIDNNSFSDCLIVEPDGSFIKKEQILMLKESFKTTSIENRPRIYWIRHADKLNKYAANSLLKFLEEPEGNVIAIIETDNRYKVIETIRSRCQVYSLINNDKSVEITEINDVINVVETLERKKIHSIAYLPIELDNDLHNREFWIDVFNSMIDIYENVIRRVEHLEYIDYGDIMNLIINNNSLQEIINKIDVLFTTLTTLDYNLNVGMMLDKFIIDFTGGE